MKKVLAIIEVNELPGEDLDLSDAVADITLYSYREEKCFWIHTRVKPLPEKLEDWQYADKYNRWGVSQKEIEKELIGYNLCVNEITGEEE